MLICLWKWKLAGLAVLIHFEPRLKISFLFSFSSPLIPGCTIYLDMCVWYIVAIEDTL